VFASHARLRGRFTLRIAINGIRTEARHVQGAWDRVVSLGRELDREGS
jgi:hypothetical protein